MVSENMVQDPELSQEEIKTAIKNAIKNGCEDSKYILILREWSYFHSTSEINVIMGDIERVLLYENQKEGEKEWEYAILPKTRTVVLFHKEKNDFDGDEEHAMLYVFTRNGWKSLHLY
jgi:hypothetical protein